jgi:hypothetical protein
MLMKSETRDSESIPSLSFGEILKAKEKQSQEVNASSVAVTLMAVQTLSMATSMLDLNIARADIRPDLPLEVSDELASDSVNSPNQTNEQTVVAELAMDEGQIDPCGSSLASPFVKSIEKTETSFAIAADTTQISIIERSVSPSDSPDLRRGRSDKQNTGAADVSIVQNIPAKVPQAATNTVTKTEALQISTETYRNGLTKPMSARTQGSTPAAEVQQLVSTTNLPRSTAAVRESQTSMPGMFSNVSSPTEFFIDGIVRPHGGNVIPQPIIPQEDAVTSSPADDERQSLLSEVVVTPQKTELKIENTSPTVDIVLDDSRLLPEIEFREGSRKVERPIILVKDDAEHSQPLPQRNIVSEPKTMDTSASVTMSNSDNILVTAYSVESRADPLTHNNVRIQSAQNDLFDLSTENPETNMIEAKKIRPQNDTPTPVVQNSQFAAKGFPAVKQVFERHSNIEMEAASHGTHTLRSDKALRSQVDTALVSELSSPETTKTENRDASVITGDKGFQPHKIVIPNREAHSNHKNDQIFTGPGFQPSAAVAAQWGEIRVDSVAAPGPHVNEGIDARMALSKDLNSTPFQGIVLKESQAKIERPISMAALELADPQSPAQPNTVSDTKTVEKQASIARPSSERPQSIDSSIATPIDSETETRSPFRAVDLEIRKSSSDQVESKVWPHVSNQDTENVRVEAKKTTS